VTDFCWPVNTTFTEAQPTDYCINEGSTPMNWEYAKFKPLNNPNSTHCYDAMTYTTSDSYTINQQPTQNKVRLTPTYNALSDISPTPRTETLIATLKSDPAKIVTTTFKVLVMEYCGCKDISFPGACNWSKWTVTLPNNDPYVTSFSLPPDKLA